MLLPQPRSCLLLSARILLDERSLGSYTAATAVCLRGPSSCQMLLPSADALALRVAVPYLLQGMLLVVDISASNGVSPLFRALR